MSEQKGRVGRASGENKRCNLKVDEWGCLFAERSGCAWVDWCLAIWPRLGEYRHNSGTWTGDERDSGFFCVLWNRSLSVAKKWQIWTRTSALDGSPSSVEGESTACEGSLAVPKPSNECPLSGGV